MISHFLIWHSTNSTYTDSPSPWSYPCCCPLLTAINWGPLVTTTDWAALAMARDASRVLNLCVDVLQVGTCQQQPSAVCHWLLGYSIAGVGEKQRTISHKYHYIQHYNIPETITPDLTWTARPISIWLTMSCLNYLIVIISSKFE